MKRQSNNLLEIKLYISFSIKALHLITTKIKFRYIKSKLKDSDQNIDILFDRIELMIKRYNDLKSENLEMKKGLVPKIKKNSLKKMTPESPTLVIRKNSLKKMIPESPTLVIRKNSLKKINLESPTLVMRKKHLVLLITQNTLEKNRWTILLQILIKKAQDLKERKNLRVEIADLKSLLLKNIVKKEQKSRIF